MSNEMKKNSILVWCNSDGDINNEPLMTYYDAYNLMKLRAVTDWIINDRIIPIDLEDPEKYISENYDIEKYIHSPGIYITPYTAGVFNDPENSCNYKIIII